MAVVRKLMNVGGSRGIVLPKPFLDQLDLDEHAEVEISLEADRIVIAPHRYASDEEVQKSARRMMAKHRRSLTKLAGR